MTDVSLGSKAARLSWIGGAVGEAVRRSTAGRLKRFVRTTESEPAILFAPAAREHSDNGDWYGEHIGKWLIAAAAAWRRDEDPELREAIAEIVRHLSECQEENGYLGTYAPGAACRFTSPEARGTRTWDLWVHAWAILGLLRASEIPGLENAKEIAKKAGDLITATFPAVHPSVLDLGNHAGLSSASVIEPLAELTLATGDERYAHLARETIGEMERRRLPLLSAADRDIDAADIGTGKAYQICWVLVGLVATYRATGERRLLRAAESLWTNIASEHLTPLGGPWGGVAGHKEVFNVRGFFSPYGMVETCAAATWMTLCRRLFEVTGRQRYVEAFERTLLNTILGAIDANGEDWCYFTFPNGRRNNTYHWACCKSSGAMALEEVSALAVTETDEGAFVNLWLPCSAETPSVHLHVETNSDSLSLCIKAVPATAFTLAIRVPHWAAVKGWTLNGTPFEAEVEEGYARLHRIWSAGDRLQIDLDQPTQVHPKTFVVDHHGQEVVRMDYAHVSRGPYVYATGLIDGFRKEETLRLARLTPEAPFRTVDEEAIDLHLPGRDPIRFVPYYRAGGQHEGAWRTTWLQVAWQ